MSDVIEESLRLDAADDYNGLVELLKREASNLDQFVFIIYQLLLKHRLKGAYVLGRSLSVLGITNPVAALAQSVGGLLLNDANEETRGRLTLQTSIDGLAAEQRRTIYNDIIAKIIPNIINNAFVNSDTKTLIGLLELLRAAVPELRPVFDLSERLPPLDLEAMRRKGRAQAELISLDGPPSGTQPKNRRAVVAIREYFLGATDRKLSRLLDIGPRIAASMNRYGWPTQFFGMQFRDILEDYRGIADMCRQTNAEILVLDDNLIENVPIRRVRAELIAQLRESLPDLKIVSVYFDPWMLAANDLREASAMVDVVWAPFPSMPLWKTPEFESKVLMATWPLGFDFTPPAAPIQPRLTFAGGVMGYNWHRALWLGAAQHEGLPIDRQVSSHKPDGLGAIESFAGYLGRLANATCSLNLSMRGDLQKVVTARTFETIFSGALLVEEWSPDLDHYFVAGEHYFPFTNFAELRAIIGFIQAHPEEAQEIRKRGNEFALQYYSDARAMGALDRLLFHDA